MRPLLTLLLALRGKLAPSTTLPKTGSTVALLLLLSQNVNMDCWCVARRHDLLALGKFARIQPLLFSRLDLFIPSRSLLIVFSETMTLKTVATESFGALTDLR